MENIQKIMQEAYKEIDNYEQSLINNNEIILLKKEIQTLEDDKRNAENLLRDSIKKEFRELADKFQEFKNENNIETIVNTIESPDKHFDDDYITNYIQDGFEISTFRSRFYSENLSISSSIWYNLKTIKGTVESISNLDTFRDFNKVRDEYTENSTIQKYLDLIKQLKEEQIKLEPSSKEIDKLEKQIKKMQKNKKVKTGNIRLSLKFRTGITVHGMWRLFRQVKQLVKKIDKLSQGSKIKKSFKYLEKKLRSLGF